MEERIQDLERRVSELETMLKAQLDINKMVVNNIGRAFDLSSRNSEIIKTLAEALTVK